MAVDITIPEMGESITEGVIVRWRKTAGETVERDEVIVEIETDKATVELPTPESGVLSEILKDEGETVAVGETIARIATDGAAAEVEAQKPARPSDTPALSPQVTAPSAPSAAPTSPQPLSPAVRRLVEEHDINPAEITATGRGGRLTKEDILQHIEAKTQEEPVQGQPRLRAVPGPSRPPAPPTPESPVAGQPQARADTRPAEEARPGRVPPGAKADARERREPMSRIRRRIAERLVHAQHTAAILTTFNEIDMTTVLALRSQYAEAFKQRFEVSLGLLGFFAKACVEALRAFPAINAEIRGEDIVYKDHYDIGIAVATEQGLLVPVIRDVDRKGLAQIEKELGDLGQRARAGKVSVEELTGGTFTISNGGVFGSLLSTPILNPPQSGILGMHKIEKRPVVVGPNDEIVVRPMMYVALSYDHRIVDGREAVLFLRRIKDCVEDPNRLILGM